MLMENWWLPDVDADADIDVDGKVKNPEGDDDVDGKFKLTDVYFKTSIFGFGGKGKADVNIDIDVDINAKEIIFPKINTDKIRAQFGYSPLDNKKYLFQLIKTYNNDSDWWTEENNYWYNNE